VIRGALACEDGRTRRGVAIATGTVAIVALFAAVASVAAEVGWRFPTDMITLQQWTTFREEVLAKPNIKRAEFANQLVITVEAERAIYVFTEPKHPAHPAVIVRVVVENGRGSIVKRMGHFAGSEAAFVSWWHEFDPLDAAIPGQQK
jgi:hypothetical protein